MAIEIDFNQIFSFIFGWIGLLSGIFFFINPFFTILNLYNGTQEIKKLSSGFDLLSILFTTLFWITSDTIAGEDFTISSDKFSQNNLIGFNLTLIAIILYLYFYVSEFTRNEQKLDLNGKFRQVRVYKTNYIKYIIFVVSVIDVCAEVLIASLEISDHYYRESEKNKREKGLKRGKRIFKGIALVINFVMYVPSWIKIIDNIRHKKYEEISIPGYILGLVRYGSWVFFGTFQYIIYKNYNENNEYEYETKRDETDYLFVLFGNLLFFIMCLIFLLLYQCVVKKNEEVSDVKPPQPDKINAEEDKEIQYEEEDEED